MNIKFFEEIFIYITKDCNLSCSYCSQKHTKWYFISEAIIDSFFSKLGDYILNNFYSINIYWWEPFLYKDRLLYLLNKISSLIIFKKKFFKVDISTNGILLNKSFIEKILNLLQNNPYLFINITISLDWDFNNNFINRKMLNSDFNKIVENIFLLKFYQKEYLNLWISLSSVIPLTYENINYFDSLSFLFKLWLKNITFILEQDVNGNFDFIDKEKKINLFKNTMERIKLLKTFIKNFYWDFLVQIVDIWVTPVISLKPNWDIYNIVCPDFFNLSDIKDEFFISNINILESYLDIEKYIFDKNLFSTWNKNYREKIIKRLFYNKKEILHKEFLSLRDICSLYEDPFHLYIKGLEIN